MKKNYFFYLSIILLTAFFVYYGSFNNGFVNADDGAQLQENKAIAEFSWKNIKIMFTSETLLMYQPLTTLCFSVINYFFDFDATAFHIFSFILHCLNIFLVFFTFKALLKNQTFSLILAGFFALHPLNVESVAWISATSTLLFTCFFFSSLWAYILFIRHKKRRWYILSVLLFILGLFSKVQITPLIGVLFLVDYLLLNPFSLKDKKVIRLLLYKIPFIALGTLFVIIALEFRGHQTAFPYFYNTSFLFPQQLSWYVFKTLIPINLGVVYDWPKNPFSVTFYISIISILGFLYSLYHLRKNKLYLFGGLFFLGNIILHTVLTSALLAPWADRYGYISSLGIWLMLYSLFSKNRKPFFITCTVLIVLFSFLSYPYTKVWKNSVTLWTNNLKHEKGNLSNLYRALGYRDMKRDNLAKIDFEKTLINTDRRIITRFQADTRLWLGLYYHKKNQLEKSEKFFLDGIRIAPKAIECYIGIAAVYFKKEAYRSAEKYLLTASKIDPKRKEVFFELSRVYAKLEQFYSAAGMCKEYLKIDPYNYEMYFFKAQLQASLGDLKNALKDIEIAISIYTQIHKTSNPTYGMYKQEYQKLLHNSLN